MSAIVIDEFRPPHFVRFFGLTDGAIAVNISEIGLTRRDSDTLIEYRIESRSLPTAGLRTAKVPSERSLHEFIVRELSAVAHVLRTEMSVLRDS